MNCPVCSRELGHLRKYEHRNCECGKQIMCLPEGKNLKLVILGENKEEN